MTPSIAAVWLVLPRAWVQAGGPEAAPAAGGRHHERPRGRRPRRRAAPGPREARARAMGCGAGRARGAGKRAVDGSMHAKAGLCRDAGCASANALRIFKVALFASSSARAPCGSAWQGARAQQQNRRGRPRGARPALGRVPGRRAAARAPMCECDTPGCGQSLWVIVGQGQSAAPAPRLQARARMRVGMHTRPPVRAMLAGAAPAAPGTGVPGASRGRARAARGAAAPAPAPARARARAAPGGSVGRAECPGVSKCVWN